MTNRPENPDPSKSPGPASRRLACPRCGVEFSCSLSGECWCDGETARLPMPVSGEDCLCRECLRKAATAQPHQL